MLLTAGLCRKSVLSHEMSGWVDRMATYRSHHITIDYQPILSL